VTGFPRKTLTFLAGLSEHNDKSWFDAHREDYELAYVAPARAFVADLGPRLREIAPGVRYEPKINGSISRINRDIRFSPDKRPYKDHLDLWFWHGQKRGWEQPGFFLRITAEDVWLGAGMHHFSPDMLGRYRDAVVDPRAGEALAAAIGRIESEGYYMVGSMARKKVPRGYDAAHPRARFLLWEGLPAMVQLPATAVLADDFSEVALAHFRATWPIGQWILDELVLA
jgi:uncharacterized protein (TIGR02453 family)